MPFPKENESAKIQGDKLESAVDRIADDRPSRERAAETDDIEIELDEETDELEDSDEGDIDDDPGIDFDAGDDADDE